MSSVTAQPSLGEIRPCLEGAIPAMMATCALDGTPKVAYISQVFYVDERHVALSFQFFNKTRQYILSNPYASVLVLHPVTAAFFRRHIRYLRTETQGPVFEGMKAHWPASRRAQRHGGRVQAAGLRHLRSAGD